MKGDSVRLDTPEAAPPPPSKIKAGNVEVELPQQSQGMQDDGSEHVADANGNIVKIRHPDGSVTISLDGKSLVDKPEDPEDSSRWFRNLAEKIDDDELYRIADDLIRGIEEDHQSRTEWLEERAKGIRLMGLKIEVPGIGTNADGAPVDGMSKVRHPLLQEAVLRFQANARSELLPTDGPLKVKSDATAGSMADDAQATALETDGNHFLVNVATEYYPDTDRMLLMLGMGGTAFKKVYYCPVRNRPAIESVDAEDLIVNATATDLRNAKRITHRSMMRPNTIKRLQILGVYRDVDLAIPQAPEFDAAQKEKHEQQGVMVSNTRPEDRDHEILECYCELEIKGYEHKIGRKETGLEVPYTVTIDKSSRKILSIVRNYDEDTKDMPVANVSFVKYSFVPGFGFYDIGLVHILGNTTNALTAVWRELLDAGMFACFPGFLIADNGMRQDTNIFRIAPGSGAQVKTSGMKIGDAIMPLPYREPSPALMQLAVAMAETGMRVGGTSEAQVGEGRADAPVGTTLAMIDQATKVMNAVHKRMHASQAEEFRLLFEVVRRYPKSFWQRNRKPAAAWDEKTFREALDNHVLTPQADPNTASHFQRVLKVAALKQLQAASQSLYDPIAIDTLALQTLGWSNPQQFFAPPQAQQQPPPEMVKMQQEGQAALLKGQASMVKAQADSAVAKAKVAEIGQGGEKGLAAAGPTPIDFMKAKATLMDANTRSRQVDVKRAEVALNDANSQEERQSKEKLELLQMGKEMILHPEEAPIAEQFADKAEGAAAGGKKRVPKARGGSISAPDPVKRALEVAEKAIKSQNSGKLSQSDGKNDAGDEK
jgi:hypothetical protein